MLQAKIYRYYLCLSKPYSPNIAAIVLEWVQFQTKYLFVSHLQYSLR